MKELLKKIVKKECQGNTNERVFCIMQRSVQEHSYSTEDMMAKKQRDELMFYEPLGIK